MAEAIWRLKFDNSLDILRIWTTGVVEVTDQDLALRLAKFPLSAKSTRAA